MQLFNVGLIVESVSVLNGVGPIVESVSVLNDVGLISNRLVY